VNRIPRWRIAAAAAVLGMLVAVLAVGTPYYVKNLKLQSYVAGLTRAVEIREQTDQRIRSRVLEKAHELGLPVTEDNVQIARQPDGAVSKIDVRYSIPVDLPGYTVKLHFYPGAGSR
jgi:hypothetical protein